MTPANQKFYKLRVTPDDAYHRALFTKLESDPKILSQLTVFHLGKNKDNPHIHSILGVSTDTDPKAFGQWLRYKDRFDKGKGQSYLTCTQVTFDGVEPWSYLFHEQPECILNKTDDYDSDQINAFRANCKVIQQSMSMLQETGSKKDRGKFLIKNTLAHLIRQDAEIIQQQKEFAKFREPDQPADTYVVSDLPERISKIIYKLNVKHSMNPSPTFIMLGYIKAIEMEYLKVNPHLHDAMINHWVRSLQLDK